MNTKVLGASYAVRGPVLDRALELQHELSDNPGSLPFDEIVQVRIVTSRHHRGLHVSPEGG